MQILSPILSTPFIAKLLFKKEIFNVTEVLRRMEAEKERIENITLRDAALNDEIDKEIEQFRALEPTTVKRKVLAVFLKISYSLKREVASQYRVTEHLREFIKRANMTLEKAGGRFCHVEETGSALGLIEKTSEQSDQNQISGR